MSAFYASAVATLAVIDNGVYEEFNCKSFDGRLNETSRGIYAAVIPRKSAVEEVLMGGTGEPMPIQVAVGVARLKLVVIAEESARRGEKRCADAVAVTTTEKVCVRVCYVVGCSARCALVRHMQRRLLSVVQRSTISQRVRGRRHRLYVNHTRIRLSRACALRRKPRRECSCGR